MISLRAKLIALVFYGCSAMAIGAYVVDSEWRSDWDGHMLADAQANQKAAEDALTKQKNMLQELDNAYKTSATLKEKHDRNVADSRIAFDRLHDQLKRIKAMPSVSDTSPIAERAAAATNRVVLAELLGISDRRAGEYAQYADENRLALMACRAEYEAVRK